MQVSRSLNGLFLIVALAALGLLMVWLPSLVVDKYNDVKELGTIWVYLYFTVVGLGAAIFLGTTGSVMWTLWSNSRRKQKRRQKRAKNPSELSAGERRQEYEENLAEVEKVHADPHASEETQEQLRPLVAKLEEKRTERRLEVVAFGTVSSGKSSLLNVLAGRDVFDTDVRGGGTTVRAAGDSLDLGRSRRARRYARPGRSRRRGMRVAEAAEAARDADLTLLVVDGPLRESEHRLMRVTRSDGKTASHSV